MVAGSTSSQDCSSCSATPAAAPPLLHPPRIPTRHPRPRPRRHAPVASQRAEMEFMEEMRCASMALAVSLESSADQRLVVMMRSLGTQCS